MIGLIVPLSGQNALLGQQMRNAATLAVRHYGNSVLDVYDSSAPAGITAITQNAIAKGDRIILGPLTMKEVRLAAPIVMGRGIPELAFTSDERAARPGVWVMGLTPRQQVERLVTAANQQDGRTRFAAFLPDTALGHAMGNALIDSCVKQNLPSPQVVFHTPAIADITEKLQGLSNIAGRETDQQNRAMTQGLNLNNQKDQPSDVPANVTNALAPPPFDALFLADTGRQLASVIDALGQSQVDSAHVRIMGPALWGAFATKLGKLHGAWFAAPDPTLRHSFIADYKVAFATTPSKLADIAYDSTALAAALAHLPGGLTQRAMLRPDGFSGVDGPFVLNADGTVSRALAIFEILPAGGYVMAHPAAKTAQVQKAPPAQNEGSTPNAGSAHQ